MKNALKLVTTIAATSLASIFFGNLNASAAESTQNVTDSMNQGAEAVRAISMPTDLLASFRSITNTVLIVAGAIAVIMMIIGGVRYILSGGDSKKVTDAKNTILYAIIGLIIVFFSYAIVHFVIGALPSSDSESALQLLQAIYG